MLFGKCIGLGGFEIEHSYQTILQEQGNNELRADTLARLAMNIAWIQTNIRDRYGSANRRSRARDSLAKRNAKARNDCVLIVFGKDTFEKLSRFIPKHHGENVVVHKLFDVLRNAIEERFAIEDRRQLAANVVQECESLGLFRKGKKKGLRHWVGVALEGKRCEFCGLFH